jgi:hypothetical protein
MHSGNRSAALEGGLALGNAMAAGKISDLGDIFGMLTKALHT